MRPRVSCMQLPVAVPNPLSHEEECGHVLRRQAVKAQQLLQCIRTASRLHVFGPVDGTGLSCLRPPSQVMSQLSNGPV